MSEADTQQLQQQKAPDARLMQHLRYCYEAESAVADAASLARVREALKREIPAALASLSEEELHEPKVLGVPGNGTSRTYATTFAHKRRIPRLIGKVAAVALMALLIGSMITVFNLARSNRSGTITSSAPDTATYVFDGTLLYKLDVTHKAITWSKQINAFVFSIAGIQPVSNGIVYVAASRNQPYVYAFNTGNGALLWRTPLAPPSTSRKVGVATQPVIAHGLVYTITDSGQIFALDATIGKQRWEYNAVSACEQHSCPNIANGYAKVAVGADGTLYAAFAGEIIALNGSQSTKLWVHFINSKETINSVAFDNGTLYVTSDDVQSKLRRPFTSSLYALSGATGQQQWAVHKQLDDFSTPVFVQGKVFVGAQEGNGMSGVYAFESSNGSLAWHKTIGVYLSPLLVVGDALYIQAFTEAGLEVGGPSIPNIRTEYMLDVSSGAVRWQHQQSRQDVMPYSFFEQNGMLYLIGLTTSKPYQRLVIEVVNASNGHKA